VRALAADALGALEPRCQAIARGLVELAELALHLAQHAAQDRALAPQHLLQAPELPRVRVAGGAPPQHLAFALVRELELHARALGQPDDLVARDFQQPAVGGMCRGLLLHRRVDDHALELGLPDRAHRHGRFDRGLQQLLDASLAENAAEAPELRRVARQARLVIGHAAEELIAVGMPVTRHPPHRSERARFRHSAPTSGV
jgi:hypothetical protein